MSGHCDENILRRKMDGVISQQQQQQQQQQPSPQAAFKQGTVEPSCSVLVLHLPVVDQHWILWEYLREHYQVTDILSRPSKVCTGGKGGGRQGYSFIHPSIHPHGSHTHW